MNRLRGSRRFVACGLIAVASLAIAITIGRAQGRGTKVLIVYDMEGLRAAEQGGDYTVASANYAKTQLSLVDEVNAAARGVMKAGATEVVLTDCHASGNAKGPDYPLDQLPAGVKFDLRDAPYDPYTDAADKSVDALVMIGMHGRSGSKGFAPHTYYGTIRWNMNGLEMSETSMVALSAARFDIPLILVTGDDVHRMEVAEFSNAEYVVVKSAVSPREATARPRGEVISDIEAAAERALRNAKTYRVYKVPARITNTFKFPMAELAAIASNFPGTVIQDDRTLGYATNNYLDALVAYRSLSNFLRYATADQLVKLISDMEGGPEFVKQARAKLPPRSYEPTSKTLTVDNKLDKWGYQ